MRYLNYQKTGVCVVYLLSAIFVGQRFKGLEKKVNETQVSNTVFGHLKATVLQVLS